MLKYLGAIIYSQFSLARGCLCRKAIFIHLVWKNVPKNSQRQDISLGASIYFHFKPRVRMINNLANFTWSFKKVSSFTGLTVELSIWIVSKNYSSESEFVYLVLTYLCCGIQPPSCFRGEGLAFWSCACLFLHTCSQWFHWLHFLHLVTWAGRFFPWLRPHFPHLGLEFCLIASMLESWERADALAPRCSWDFMSLTVTSIVLAMSIALSRCNLSSFPKRTSCTFHLRVPIISCSIRRSSSSASLNRRFCACILHRSMNECTLSSSAGLKPWSWYLAIRKFDVCFRCVANLSKYRVGFRFLITGQVEGVKDFSALFANPK